ncbi:helix-turn-helix transcriptional regulator [Pirellulales bacterium]|nr:helix-turn-helix transcriptional regulator [Pirellulales bacterium]
MDLTAEQEEQLRQAKVEGDRRVTMHFTPEQKKQWQGTVDLELAGKDENSARFRKMMAAAEKSGFLGDIRRAMMLSRLSIAQLADTIRIDPRLLSDFCAGDADLPSEALDRLVETLGLRLMKEIPR